MKYKRGDKVQWIGILNKPVMGLVAEPHLFRGVVLSVNEKGEVRTLITDPMVCEPSTELIPAINLEKM